MTASKFQKICDDLSQIGDAVTISYAKDSVSSESSIFVVFEDRKYRDEVSDSRFYY